MLTIQEKYVIKCDNCEKEEVFENWDKKSAIDGKLDFYQSKFYEWEGKNYCSKECINKKISPILSADDRISSLKNPFELSLEKQEKQKKAKQKYEKSQKKTNKWVGEGMSKEKRIENYLKDVKEIITILEENQPFDFQSQIKEAIHRPLRWIYQKKDVPVMSDEWDNEFKKWDNEQKEFSSKIPKEQAEKIKSLLPSWVFRYDYTALK